jgi:hypothetical protein
MFADWQVFHTTWRHADEAHREGRGHQQELHLTEFTTLWLTTLQIR